MVDADGYYELTGKDRLKLRNFVSTRSNATLTTAERRLSESDSESDQQACSEDESAGDCIVMELTDEQCLLTDPTVIAFGFSSKQWCE